MGNILSTCVHSLFNTSMGLCIWYSTDWCRRTGVWCNFNNSFASETWWNFANCYHEINESNYEVFVTDALRALVTAPAYNAESTQNYQISQATYAVISIFFQWLTRYFCKCLMQLMTSEALTVHHLNIPRPYIWSYLH